MAIRYRVAVGRASEQWEGRTVVNGRHVRPAWSPPAVVRLSWIFSLGSAALYTDPSSGLAGRMAGEPSAGG